ncbi:MAG TPA: hypothetical protein VFB48_04300 [Nitrososphaeraceae archaeon]|nr:hypothetical protein [Nitrososphaeraceae archaeon]
MKFDLKFIVQPHENFNGLSYGCWTSIWWNWLFSDQIQFGSVYFLRGNTDKESPIIRTGKDGPMICSDTAIFFPIICTISSEHMFEHASTQSTRRSESAERQKNPLLLSVKINGVKIPNLKNYYAESPEFVLDIPKSSKIRLSFDPLPRIGKMPAVSAGYWIMLRPLPPGTYRIIFKAKHSDGNVSHGKAKHADKYVAHGDYTIRVIDSFK